MSSTPHDPFYSSPFGPFYRRHTPYMVQPEYRIYEMNKRLQSRTEDSDNLWWDAFATEFFEDDATLTLSFCLEDGPKRYRLKRFRATILRSRPPSAPQPRRRAKNPSALRLLPCSFLLLSAPGLGCPESPPNCLRGKSRTPFL
uniref:LIM domain binding 2 n=1 Tax=Equus asinus TaxID=9793 RepID=A0A9L0JBZ6_EQUAS